VQSIGASEFSLENLRRRLQDMSDEELIRYGKACRDMLTPQANLGRPPREVFVVQLQEARKEWRRRHPKESKTPRRYITACPSCVELGEDVGGREGMLSRDGF
jgi:hypothetical protein